jgi:ATP-dependent protease Clp ATPase subunit
LENFLRAVLAAADDDAEIAQRGILLLDGVERFEPERPLTGARALRGEDVQRELLSLLDGLAVSGPRWYARRLAASERTQLTCRHVLVVATARIAATAIPARGGERELRRALVAEGLLDEFVARFDRVVPLSLLDAAGHQALLAHRRGPVAEARRIVAALGGTLEYTEQAARALAEAATGSPDGARLLCRVVNHQLEEILTAEAPARAWVVDERSVRSLLAEVG